MRLSDVSRASPVGLLHFACRACSLDAVDPCGPWPLRRPLPAASQTRVMASGRDGSPLLRGGPSVGDPLVGRYLVDPASSHMLVSKIKPCMCKYELIQTVKLRMAH